MNDEGTWTKNRISYWKEKELIQMLHCLSLNTDAKRRELSPFIHLSPHPESLFPHTNERQYLYIDIQVYLLYIQPSLSLSLSTWINGLTFSSRQHKPLSTSLLAGTSTMSKNHRYNRKENNRYKEESHLLFFVVKQVWIYIEVEATAFLSHGVSVHSYSSDR